MLEWAVLGLAALLSVGIVVMVTAFYLSERGQPGTGGCCHGHDEPPAPPRPKTVRLPDHVTV